MGDGMLSVNSRKYALLTYLLLVHFGWLMTITLEAALLSMLLSLDCQSIILSYKNCNIIHYLQHRDKSIVIKKLVNAYADRTVFKC